MEDITTALNGQMLHGVDEFGVRWKTTLLTGWWESTESTGNTYQNQMSDGGWVDEAFDSSRVLVAGGTIRGPSRPATSAALSRLMAALPTNSLAPFVVAEDGLTRYALVRKQSKPVTNWESDTLVTWNIQLSAPDHRLLAGDGSAPPFGAGPVGLPKTVGGLRLKPGGVRVRPLRVVARVTSGQLVLGTAGTAAPSALLRLRGPLPDFTITATSGDWIQVMRYTEPVPAGQFVDVDLDAKTVKINGTVSRRNKLVGSWIRPADGMVFKFDSSVQNDTASMELFASSAWR